MHIYSAESDVRAVARKEDGKAGLREGRGKVICLKVPLKRGNMLCRFWRFLILLKQETVSGSGISWDICKSAPHSRQVTTADFERKLIPYRRCCITEASTAYSPSVGDIVDTCAVELSPMPTKEMVSQYNELRQDIVLLYELKLALANCQYELQTLRHRYETLAADRVSVALFTI